MSGSYYLPAKARITSFKINGYDMSLHLKNMQIFETMCKPYLTGKFMIVDNNNMINSLRISEGEPVYYEFDNGVHNYKGTQYILSINGEESTESSRAKVYTISTASMSYFKDKGQLVQKSFMNITPTMAAQMIHGEYLSGDGKGLNVDVHQIGLIATNKSGGYQVMNKKPFKAIEDLLHKHIYAGYVTSTPCYFLANDGFHMGPAQYYFDTASNQISDGILEQRDTWGENWHHVWRATHAIIGVRTVKEEDAKTGRGAGGAIAAAMSGAKNVFDVSKGISSVKSIASGGLQGVFSGDSFRAPLSVEQAAHQPEIIGYQAQLKKRVNYLVKCPIQSGLQCTVGKGVTLSLIPPVGDQNGRPGKEDFLVADIMHEVWADKRELQATTTMRCVAKGSDKGSVPATS